ncbi:hypothetical protein EJP82_25230 [Paenibacillus anaericanus]|uniref:Transposase IS4-like domain-containing protein n=1 Tax=Paenibacillus anaericanus TaxID=170367 RepID=A0A433XZ21_9BACL|nr:hypothetical protein EJP82_25230 [Paenibacillus anaericanus]
MGTSLPARYFDLGFIGGGHRTIYKSRWLVELFFKWIKQHLSTVHVHSYKPQAIWYQLFLVVITALWFKRYAAQSL